MRILGLSKLSRDSAVALLDERSILAALEEEKLTRLQEPSYVPRLAIARIFDHFHLKPSDLNAVAFAELPPSRSKQSATAHAALQQLRQLLGGHSILRFDHHLCHAASAFYLSPFEQSLIVTMDEDGDGNSATLAVGQGKHIRVLRKFAFPHSLAWVYSRVTDLIGFQPHREEHKTQWLSLDGQPVFQDVFVKMLRDGRRALPRLDYTFFNRGLVKQWSFSAKFYRSTGLPSDRKQLSREQRQALASSIQGACAEVIYSIVEELRGKLGIRKVCLGGGLFQNVVLVSSLERALGLEEVFVPPAPGNAGTALGAAYLAWHELFNQPRIEPVSSVAWGPQFKRQDTKDVLENCKARYSLQNTDARGLEAANDVLQAGKIVGWFQGATEFGPRALGNRSLLASPWAPYVKENLNDYIKHREWFRPFAISVPEEDYAQYFEASSQCRFMNSLGWLRSCRSVLPESFLLPGQQVRLHIVERRSNPLFWGLLKRFGEQAPAPMLLNTSFNLFGEPLVVTPRDAVRSYFGSGIDALMIDHFVLSKAAMRMSSKVATGSAVGLSA